MRQDADNNYNLQSRINPTKRQPCATPLAIESFLSICDFD